VNYYYYQQVGGEEVWKPIREDKVNTLVDPMFVTILSVDVPIQGDATKEQLAEVKYRGSLYFDLDDAESPASTSIQALKLVNKLEEHGVFPKQLEIYASGGKGFHIIVPEDCFLVKPPKSGMANLPAIYKELAFILAVDSMDFRVYTARKGRMFRKANVKRPNDLYKVRLSFEELEELADLASADATASEAAYRAMCAAPRSNLDIEQDSPEIASGMLALFDAAKAKVSKAAAKSKKQKPVKFPEHLPSFDALLRGEGIKGDSGFHPIAMQVAITAHARGMSLETLLESATGLCEAHESDGSRYDTVAKRRDELRRMYDYTDDNPCYVYSPHAIGALLTHNAPDLHGLEVTEEEVQEGIASEQQDEGAGEYSHANVVMTNQGVFTLTEAGPKLLSATSFHNVIELRSMEDGGIIAMEADMQIGSKRYNKYALVLDDFNSVSNFNRMVMRFGQAFSGNDIQARGVYMRVVEKANKSGKSMYVIAKEGLSVVKIPFHENDQAKRGFLVWADSERVIVEPLMEDAGLALRFVGFPEKSGQFQTDLSSAPNLAIWLKEGDNKEEMRKFLKNLLYCQSPSYLSKLLGWMMACHYRALFHETHKQFPLLHINGAAGAGKCFARDTSILMADGTRKPVQDVVVGDTLLGPDGKVRNVLSLGRGREEMFKVSQLNGDSYTVNKSHILSLKGSETKPRRLADGQTFAKGVVNVTVKDYLASNKSAQKSLKGWKPEAISFTAECPLPVSAYWLGSWIGDGKSSGPMLCKPSTTQVYKWWKEYAASKGHETTAGNSGTCDTLGIVRGQEGNYFMDTLRSLNLVGNKHIPAGFLTAAVSDRLELLAGLIDTDGTVNNAGYRFDTLDEKLASDVEFVSRSVGLKASKSSSSSKSNFKRAGCMWHVYISGNVEAIPTKDKKAATRKNQCDSLVTGVALESVGEGDYYGFEIDGDRLFLLGDFTVAHNTQMTALFSKLHYYAVEPKMLTPTSTVFAVGQAVSASSSIPLIVDEFKPADMKPEVYDKFKLMFRDAYNCRVVEKGGGTRENADYRAVHRTQLSAPICFIAEAAESETAVMERVVLLTLVKPPVIQAQQYFVKFKAAVDNSWMLGIIGHYCSAQIVKRGSMQALRDEFDSIYAECKIELMLQETDTDLTAEEHSRKSSAKERTVYNYSVVRFGLAKLKNLITGIYGSEFDEVFDNMQELVTDSVEDIQNQTMPEWLKVLNCFADMSRVDDLATYRLVEGKDFAFATYNGKDCLELYVRSCYFKYRAYCGASRSKPLFPSEAAFVHSLKSLTATVASGASVQLDCPGGSHLLDLAELRSAGFIAP